MLRQLDQLNSDFGLVAQAGVRREAQQRSRYAVATSPICATSGGHNRLGCKTKDVPSDRNLVIVCSTDEVFSRALGHALFDHKVESVDEQRLGELEATALVWKVNGAVPPEVAEVAARLPTLLLADDRHLLAAVDAGCRGFLPSDAGLDDIRSAVMTISSGGAVIPPSMLGSLLRHLVQRRRVSRELEASLTSLTPRERDVYRLAARGLGREEIGTVLFISPDTVRTHLQRIYAKLGVHSQVELATLSAQISESEEANGA